MKVVLTFYSCDASRTETAAAICRTRHADDDQMGWDEAAAVLERALARLRDAGADSDEDSKARFADQLSQEMFAEVQPYTWPDRADRRRAWWRRLWHHARLHWRRRAPQTAAGHQLLLL